MKDLRLLGVAVPMALAAACGGKEQADEVRPPAGREASRCVNGRERCRGRVTLDGAVPANPPIKMSADPFCAAQNPNGATFENFVVDNGGLENVFVYVKDGLGELLLRCADRAGQARSAGLPLSPARARHPRRTSRSRSSTATTRMHNVHAMPNAEPANSTSARRSRTRSTADVHEARSDGAVQVRRAQMDARVRRRDRIIPTSRSPHDGGKFELKNLPAGHLYARSVAREARHQAVRAVTIGEKDSERGDLHIQGCQLQPADVLAADELVASIREARRRVDGAADCGRRHGDQHRLRPLRARLADDVRLVMFSFPFNKWVGGILYEHGHRLIASTVGFLTIILADLDLAGRAATHGCGGSASLRLAPSFSRAFSAGSPCCCSLPPAVSIGHAGLAQLFFCITLTLALVTSRGWRDSAVAGRRSLLRRVDRSPRRRSSTCQILLGATMRHTGAGMAIPTFPLAFGHVLPPVWSRGDCHSLRPSRRRARRRSAAMLTTAVHVVSARARAEESGTTGGAPRAPRLYAGHAWCVRRDVRPAADSSTRCTS